MAETEPMCPIRVGDYCSLCHPGASGPATCGLVYLVMNDPDLHGELLARWAAWEEERDASSGSRERSAGQDPPVPG